jgi:hypothetical protein
MRKIKKEAEAPSLFSSSKTYKQILVKNLNIYVFFCFYFFLNLGFRI